MLIDVLGHPIEAGMTVLTTAHYGSTMDQLVKIDKVTKKSVYVTLTASWYNWREKVWCTEQRSIRRRPNKVLVIDKQLKYNRKMYPEYMI